MMTFKNLSMMRHRLVPIYPFSFTNFLEKDTEKYSAVPKFWRNHIDDSIDFWKKQFTDYCHDLNRNTLKVFISTHGDFDKTFHIMHSLIQNTGVKNIEKHIAETVRSAKLQLKNQPIAPVLETAKTFRHRLSKA